MGVELPVSARQMYYAVARPNHGGDAASQNSNSQYFTQTILPQYIACHQQETRDWDVTYDARGHFAEPHTTVITPLGTLDVRGYLADVRDHTVEPLNASHFFSDGLRRFPTCGPEHRFSARNLHREGRVLAVVCRRQAGRAIRHRHHEHQGDAGGGLPLLGR